MMWFSSQNSNQMDDIIGIIAFLQDVIKSATIGNIIYISPLNYSGLAITEVHILDAPSYWDTRYAPMDYDLDSYRLSATDEINWCRIVVSLWHASKD